MASKNPSSHVDERYYRTLYDLSPDIILTLDGDMMVVDVNRRGQTNLGLNSAQDLPQSLSVFLDQPSGAALTGLLAAGFEGVGESHVNLRDGRRMHFSAAQLDQERTLLVLHDVTQSYLLAQKLESTRRLASVGRMAGALAHEITNPLSVIHGRVEVLQAMRQVKPADLQRQLAIMSDHCKRIAGMVRNLQTLSVPVSISRSWIMLDEVLNDSLEQIGRRIGRVELDADFGPIRPRMYADRTMLLRLVSSLLSFAADQSPSGSTLTLRATQLPDDAIQIRLQDQALPLSKDLIAELEQQSGSYSLQPTVGLGLAVVASVVHDHGGVLKIEARPGTGNTYKIELPGDNSTSEPVEGVDRQILEVLVVDDDALLCETVTWMLSMDGHRITDVRSGEEALIRLQTQSFDVAIVDMRLPHMTGLELLAAMESQFSAQADRVVLTSGLLDRPERTNPYLQKPFTRKDLLDAIEQVCHEGQG